MKLAVTCKDYEVFLKYRRSVHGRVPGIAGGIQKYSSIMIEANGSSFSPSSSLSFQTTFQLFYQLSFKKPAADEAVCRATFFQIMEKYNKEKIKNVGTTKEIKSFDIKLYERVLKDLYTIASRCEVSFASKLLHTLYPDYYPIYDRIVGCNHFGIRNNWRSLTDAVRKYKEYNRRFIASLSASSSISIIGAFDKEYASELSSCGYKINNLKKADFIMWVDRPESNIPLAIQFIAP